jgi:fatty acid desaturase
MAQLLISSSVAPPSASRAILSFGMVCELLGTILAIVSLRDVPHSENSGSTVAPSTEVPLKLRVAYVLIAIGVADLVVVLVIEAFKAPLPAAVTMLSTCFIGISVFLLSPQL